MIGVGQSPPSLSPRLFRGEGLLPEDSAGVVVALGVVMARVEAVGSELSRRHVAPRLGLALGLAAPVVVPTSAHPLPRVQGRRLQHHGGGGSGGGGRGGGGGGGYGKSVDNAAYSA